MPKSHIEKKKHHDHVIKVRETPRREAPEMSESQRDTSLLEYLAETALEDIRRARKHKKNESEQLLKEAGELSNLVSRLLAKRETIKPLD